MKKVGECKKTKEEANSQSQDAQMIICIRSLKEKKKKSVNPNRIERESSNA